LVRMRELAVQMANGTYDSDDRGNADKEFGALKSEIDRIASNSKFNRTAIAGGGTVTIQSGSDKGDQLASLSLPDLSTVETTGLGVTASYINTAAVATTAVSTVDAAIVKVAGYRAQAGANINRLGFALSNAQNVSQRLKEALSGLEDTDYAAESAALARGMVLAQAGSAMLAQANQAPQYVLTLHRG
ncbi:MAG: flagellin, partial [Betaproteobacteria bacterium]